jgi:hypothetical protein
MDGCSPEIGPSLVLQYQLADARLRHPSDSILGDEELKILGEGIPHVGEGKWMFSSPSASILASATAVYR